MPLYDFICPAGHRVERLRKYDARDEAVYCDHHIMLAGSIVACSLPMYRTISAPHVEPDGVYSHEPNMGSKDNFDRQYEERKANQRARR